MRPPSDWSTPRLLLTGGLSGALIQLVVYFSNWGFEKDRMIEILGFTGFGAVSGAVLFYALSIMSKANRR